MPTSLKGGRLAKVTALNFSASRGHSMTDFHYVSCSAQGQLVHLQSVQPASTDALPVPPLSGHQSRGGSPPEQPGPQCWLSRLSASPVRPDGGSLHRRTAVPTMRHPLPSAHASPEIRSGERPIETAAA